MVTEQEVNQEEVSCPYCEEFEYPGTPRGRLAYGVHLKTVHPDQTKRAKTEKQSTSYTDALSPMGLRFHTALLNILPPGKASLVRSMTDLFNRSVMTLSQSRHRFRSWVTKYGLTSDQIALLEDQLFGLEDDKMVTGDPSLGGGQAQMAYLPLPGGGVQPIYILPFSSGGGPAPPPQSVPSFGGMGGMPGVSPFGGGMGAPPWWGGGGGGGDSALRDVKDEVRALSARMESVQKETLEQVAQLIGSRQETGYHGPTKRQPILDDAGNWMKDGSGQPLWQEVPYDPEEGVLSRMKMYRELLAPPVAPPLTVEQATLLMREEIGKLDARRERPAEVPPQVQAILDEMRSRLEEANLKLSGIERDKELQAAVRDAVAPLAAQLSEIRNVGEMTDSQAMLRHRENMTRGWQEFLGSVVGSVRGDLRPAVLNGVISTLRAQGASDEVIGMVVQSSSAIPASGSAIRGKVEEARERWLRS